jgi:hypothetical protein
MSEASQIGGGGSRYENWREEASSKEGVSKMCQREASEEVSAEHE